MGSPVSLSITLPVISVWANPICMKPKSHTREKKKDNIVFDIRFGSAIKLQTKTYTKKRSLQKSQ